MRESAASTAGLRPCRSPKWPKTAPPMGRATNPTATVANEASVAASGLNLAEKKTWGNTIAAAVV